MSAVTKLFLSAVAVIAGAALAMFNPAIANPSPIIYVGFTDTNGNWVDDGWTNYYTLTVLVSSNQVNWRATNIPLNIHDGQLSFGISNEAPQQFCRAMFTPTNQ